MGDVLKVQGQDILANRQLSIFWEAIEEILDSRQSDYVQCYDFLVAYNQRELANEE